jgi:hypothetical protein
VFHGIDVGAEIFGERDEMALFALAAFEAIGAAVERNADLSHGMLPLEFPP